jgi:hypothetical protein
MNPLRGSSNMRCIKLSVSGATFSKVMCRKRKYHSQRAFYLAVTALINHHNANKTIRIKSEKA